MNFEAINIKLEMLRDAVKLASNSSQDAQDKLWAVCREYLVELADLFPQATGTEDDE